MPVYLEEKETFPELGGCQSVLIVPCRFCPAASMAVKKQAPYFEFMRQWLKTAAYERLIDTIRSNFSRMGVKSDIFKSLWPHQFVICMWSSRRRRKLMKLAGSYDALLVLGCEAAVQTVQDAVQGASCRVLQGMSTQGIMSIQPRWQPPCNISLELNGVTPLVHQPAGPEPRMGCAG